MEITEAVLTLLKETTPGNYAVYEIADGRIIRLLRSAGLPALIGLTEEEYDSLESEDALGLVLESDRARVAALLPCLLAGGGDTDFAFRVRHREKVFIWIHAFARLIGMKDGRPVVTAIFHEVGKKDMDFVVDSIPVGIGVCTVAEGKVAPVAINRKMTELLGTTAELFTKDDGSMFANVHTEDAAAVMRVMSGCAVPGFEGRMDYRYRPSGTGDWR